jgi:hypothetical protein
VAITIYDLRVACIMMGLLSVVFQLARRCERVLINKYLDVFYSEFVTLLHDDREEGK